MKTSESVANISAALAKAHAKIKHATKDAKNPHFRNDYATLESVIDATKDALLSEGIVTIQSPGQGTLTTRLQHVSGEFIEETMDLILTKQDMQALGSSITYARRYQLSAMTNTSQSDDDGNLATGKDTTPPPKRAVTKAKASTGNSDFGF